MIRNLLILLFATTVFAQQPKLLLGTSKKTVEKSASLSLIDIPSIGKNLAKYVSPKSSQALKWYLYDDYKKFDVCDLPFFTFLAFSNDTLIAIVHSTEELPYSKEDPKQKCSERSFFNEAELDFWRIIPKTKWNDGNCFYEGGYTGVGETENSYLLFINSQGTVSSPSHNQYSYFFIDKKYLDALYEKCTFHKTWKSELHPTILFSDALEESAADFLKKKPKE